MCRTFTFQASPPLRTCHTTDGMSTNLTPSLVNDAAEFDVAVLGVPIDTAVSYRYVCKLTTVLALVLVRGVSVLGARGKPSFALSTQCLASIHTCHRPNSLTVATCL